MINPVSIALGQFIQTFEPNPAVWPTLVAEEAAEVKEALADLLKEFCDLVYVLEGATQAGHNLNETVPTDLQVFIQSVMGFLDGYEALFGDGVTGEAFKRVHESNMSKLTADGQVLRREDGKVLKSDLYRPANLLDLITPRVTTTEAAA